MHFRKENLCMEDPFFASTVHDNYEVGLRFQDGISQMLIDLAKIVDVLYHGSGGSHEDGFRMEL